MRTGVAVAVAIASSLALPVSANAACSCRAWSYRFATSSAKQRQFSRDWRRDVARSPARARARARNARKPVKKQVKSFGRLGKFSPADWCAKNSRQCKAAIACLWYGTLAWDGAIQGGASVPTALRIAVNACVAAAVWTIVYG